jgi:hypothetical protein
MKSKLSIFDRAKQNIETLLKKRTEERFAAKPDSAISTLEEEARQFEALLDKLERDEKTELSANSPARRVAASGTSDNPIKGAFARAASEPDALKRAELFSQASALVNEADERLTPEERSALRESAARETDPNIRARLFARARRNE